jgi:glyoxylase-like metal-dependent hydrolase (beta-lactamase superfamily II)
MPMGPRAQRTREMLAMAGVAAVLASACSSAPTARGLAQDAVTAMGGVERLRGIQALVMSGGSGTRNRLGQTVRVSDPDGTAQLSNVIEAIDLTNGRAALDYQIENAGFMQHRQEVLTKVADGVYFARAYSHNSMVVEFPTFLAVVEAAYTDAQSHTLARALELQFPGKPIRYAAVTHHHYDHTGGVRTLASYGATLLVERGHEPEMRMVLETPHTNPPDPLETKRKAGEAVGIIEVFEGKKVVSEGGQSLELYAITGNPHVDPKVIAYVPTSRVLFQSDIFFPAPVHPPLQTPCTCSPQCAI